MDKLIERLNELAEWADGMIWDLPIDLPDRLREAVRELQAHQSEHKDSCLDCVHLPVCELWLRQECQNASIYCGTEDGRCLLFDRRKE